VAAGLVVIKPFFGRKTTTKREPHMAPLSMWIGPLILAVAGLLFAVLPRLIDGNLIKPASDSVQHIAEYEKLSLWHGFNVPLLLSVVTIALAVMVYVWRDRLLPTAEKLDGGRIGPERWYEVGLDRFLKSADAITYFLQNGNLRIYLNVIVATAVLLSGGAFFAATRFVFPINLDIGGVTVLEWVLAIMIVIAAIATTLFRSRMAAITALGAIGYSMALLFLLFGAPDLAMTQFAIETLTVILIVLIIWKLPRFEWLTTPGDRAKDIIIAVAAGALVTLFVLVISAEPFQSRLAPYFAENSYLLAKGHNVVNVILVDFRGFDTLGEITVLSVAAFGVFVLSQLRSEHRKRPDDDG
jgi:multicomponent Na+:H+ antiporter subunit A